MDLEPQTLLTNHYGRTTTNQEKRWILRTLELVAERCLATKETPTLLEIGTQYGKTSRVVLEALDDLSCPAEYVTVDINSWAETEVNFREACYDRSRITVHRRRAHSVYSAVDNIAWLFIDGCHCQECVEKDLENYVPHVAPGGYLLVHDCSPIFNTSAMRTEKYHGEPWRGIGVYKAVVAKQHLLAEFNLVAQAPPKQTGDDVYFGGMFVYVRRGW